ncbi:MAG: murein L,D-transpeptidase catalytic domain family protein [Bacteroidota bacterium]
MRLGIGVFLLLLFGFVIHKKIFEPQDKISAPKSLPADSISADEVAKTLERLRLRSSGLRKFLAGKKMNASVCFFADMSIASGRPRFFVFDLANDSTLTKGLVTNGSGRIQGSAVQYSNELGSLCTSLGRYKVGSSYMGKFGLAYKLDGMDATNDNAMKRFLVLHSHPCVPEDDVWPEKICSSWGCPTVSPMFLIKLSTYLQHSDKPMLLWVFN